MKWTKDALQSADGLLLGGGADVDPARYGEAIRWDNLVSRATLRTISVLYILYSPPLSWIDPA